MILRGVAKIWRESQRNSRSSTHTLVSDQGCSVARTTDLLVEEEIMIPWKLRKLRNGSACQEDPNVPSCTSFKSIGCFVLEL